MSESSAFLQIVCAMLAGVVISFIIETLDRRDSEKRNKKKENE